MECHREPQESLSGCDKLLLFIKILKALGRKDILKTYMYFGQQLHSLGFYERIVPESDLEETIREDVPRWIHEAKLLVRILEHVDLSHVAGLVEEIDKTRQRILRAASEYMVLQQKLSEIIAQQISSVSKVSSSPE